jgi:hypothetical protein
LRGATDYMRGQTRYCGDSTKEEIEAADTLYNKLVDAEQHAERTEPLAEHERHEQELRAAARVLWPNPTPERALKIDELIRRRVEAHIDKSNERKVREAAARGISREELQVREFEKHLRRVVAEKFPNASAEERTRLYANVDREVAEYRQALAQQMQAQQADHGQKSQGRGLSQPL